VAGSRRRLARRGLALPLTTDAGEALPGRDLILFVTFAVILFRRRRLRVLAGKIDDEDGIRDRSLAYQRLMHEERFEV